jgi:DNA gyrase/topoisomerase IV subunit A
MVTPEKIDEWLKEAEARPGSALLLLKQIASRLRDLSTRNEDLLAENIALQNGEQVEEYKKRITHLEYQLALLKRRFGEGELASIDTVKTNRFSLLFYDLKGRVLRMELDPVDLNAGVLPGKLAGEKQIFGESPRLLALPSDEELLFLYSSGRVSTHPVSDIPSVTIDGEWMMDQASLPGEAHSGERLVCLLPFSQLPLADYFLQASRRGCVKKTMTTIAESVLTNHFIGRGIIQKADQPFEIMLCRKQETVVLLTSEGILLCLDVDDLTYTAEERLQLAPTDHVVAAYPIQDDAVLLVLTQTGKVILRPAENLEPVRVKTAKGIPLIPSARRDKGVRIIGSALVHESDRVFVLMGDGSLKIHNVMDLTSSGAIQSDFDLLAFTTYPDTLEGG